MDFLKFDAVKCTLCGKCIDKCPFGALRIEGKGIAVGDTCRMCGMCVRSCPSGGGARRSAGVYPPDGRERLRRPDAPDRPVRPHGPPALVQNRKED